MKLTQDVINIVESLPDEDIRQDVYVKLLEGNLPKPENPRAYIQTLYVNLLRDDRRKEKRRAELTHENARQLRNLVGDDDTGDPVEYMESEELSERVAELSPLLMKTLIRHELDGKSVEEIAEEEKVGAGVIYTRLHRARQQLQK